MFILFNKVNTIKIYYSMNLEIKELKKIIIKIY